MFVELIAYGILLPAGVAALAWVAGWRPWRRDPSVDRWAWACGALAVAGGLLAAQTAILGLPAMPPIQAQDWLALLLLAAAGLGLADGLIGLPVGLRWTLRGLFSAAVPLVLLLPLARHTWSSAESVAILTAVAAGVFGLWSLLDVLIGRVGGPSGALILGTLAGGTAVALGLAGSASLAQLAGALAVVLGVAFGLALLQPAFRLARGSLPPLAVGLSGLWLNGAFYADLPIPSLLLLAGAPALALAAGMGPLARLEPWRSALVRTAAVAVAAAVACALALSAGPPLGLKPYW